MPMPFNALHPVSHPVLCVSGDNPDTISSSGTEDSGDDEKESKFFQWPLHLTNHQRIHPLKGFWPPLEGAALWPRYLITMHCQFT